MYKKIIYNYINNIKKEDIIYYSIKEGIILSKYEIDIIYDYIKNKYLSIIDNPNKILTEIKEKVSNETYHKLLELYDKYKDIINKIKDD